MLLRRSSSSRVSPITFAMLATLVGCSSSSSPSTPDGGTDAGSDAAPPTTFVATFDLPTSGPADVMQVPFPSDQMLAADGTIALPLGTTAAPTGLQQLLQTTGGAQYVLDSLKLTHGFGTYGGTIFALTGSAPDRTKLPLGAAGDCTSKTSPVFYVDVDAAGGAKLLECQAHWSDDTDYNTAASTQPTLVVQTARGVVLPEGHKIAVLLTSQIVDASSNALTASAGFVAVRDGTRTDAAAASYASAIASAATAAGIDKSTVVSAAVYTTGHVTDELRAARDLATAQPVPKLAWGASDVAPVTAAKFTSTSPLPTGWTATLDDWLGTPNKLPDGTDDPDFDGGTNPGVAHDAIGAVGVASIQAPSFLQVAAKGYADPVHATFAHDATGNVQMNPANPTARVWVSFVVPKTAMPPGGYPIVVYQHGMGGARQEILTLANEFAKQGWATAAIELVQHGTRNDDAVGRGDSKSDVARSTSKYMGADGFSDTSPDGSNASPINFFGSLYRIAALRDQMRQSAIDHATLAQLLKSSPTLDGLAQGTNVPKIDGSKVAYVGDSLGGMTGALVAGLQVEHAAYVLNVTGAGLMRELATYSPNIYSLYGGAASLYFGFKSIEIPPWHPLTQMMQHIVDGGDPLTSASHAIVDPLAVGASTPAPRNILLFEVLADELVPNEATEALVRTMGLGMMLPHDKLTITLPEVMSGVHDSPLAGMTGTVVQLYPASHGEDLYFKTGERDFEVEAANWSIGNHDVFPQLKTPVAIDEPYLAVHKAALAFISAAFAASVPTVTWTESLGSPTDNN